MSELPLGTELHLVGDAKGYEIPGVLNLPGANTVVSTTVLDITDRSSIQDVTADTLIGNSSISGDLLSTALIHDLTPNRKYRVVVILSDGGSQRWSIPFDLICRDTGVAAVVP